MDSNDTLYWRERIREVAEGVVRDPEKTPDQDWPASEIIVLKGGGDSLRDYLSRLIQEEFVKRGSEVKRVILFTDEIYLTSADGIYDVIKEYIESRTPNVFTIVMDPNSIFETRKPYSTLEEKTYSIDVRNLEKKRKQRSVRIRTGSVS